MTAARRRRLRRFTSTAALVVAVVAWALLFRPQALGGPAAYVMVSGTSMEPGLHTGDLVIARKRESYRVGDVITYAIHDPGANGAQVIHRITGGSAEAGFVTQGDNRQSEDLWRPQPNDIAGELWFSVPKIALVLAYTRTAPGLALLAAIIAFAVVVAPEGRRKRARPADAT